MIRWYDGTGGVVLTEDKEYECVRCGRPLRAGDRAWDLHAGGYPAELVCMACAG